MLEYAAEISLPVWTPATTEAFATYGEIDKGAISQPVKAPPNVFTQFGGLEISTSSTQLQELTDAVLYLTAYPYECSEQLSSRILAIAALKDVLTAFKARDLPSVDEMKAAVARDIKRLQGMQNGDGGFGFWRRGDESWPYVSIHVAHALARAKDKGFDVPDDMLEKSRNYLREIEEELPTEDYIVPLGKAAIRREGKDITLVSYGQNVYHCLDAATELEKIGVSAEVIDLRSLVPLDEETVFNSIAKTSRVIVVNEAPMTCGFAGELVARISTKAFHLLDAPPSRVTRMDTPVPWVKPLEMHVLPTVDKIVAEAMRIVKF